ncbi:DUF2004 domain-containing protein [Prosthecobacter sp.]|uniref:DUF2004 domain-containing protein n=1 Tax=Prosthecobacter sp. TaxID=1965333 RepID=UPI002ABC1652|nr:DUF2004 domain-containing protein [Prosthecobacter sp.]MDZ4405913.1 DUF2004 domain-containing protein [Prosthecobacter sp.]
MSPNTSEIEKRRETALAAIKTAYGTEEDEFGATMFVSHHLEELDASYWLKHLQAASPEPTRVLDMLVLRSHWGDEDENGIDTFDFTLPDEITNYVISVRFSEDGSVNDISMES